MFSGFVIIRCLMRGQVFCAWMPSSSLATGTSLQPMISMPRALTVFSASSVMVLAADGLSFGRKNTPTARSAGSVTLVPSFSASSLKSLRGICERMPDPSPVFMSASMPPRWVMLQTDSIALLSM